jgi:hypothetical protein
VRLSPALVGIVLALAAPACGSDDSAIRSAWETFARIDCEKAHECRDSYWDSPAAFEGQYGTSVDACTREALDAAFNALVGAYEEAVASGQLVYSADNAQSCADAKRAQSCADYWGGAPISVCYTVFTGHVASGGACQSHAECMSGMCVSQTCL